MSEYRAITITKGSGGFGGPLTVEPKEGKDVLLYITGGGAEPDILPKIVELTGCRPVNGFKTSVPEEEIFLVIVIALYSDIVFPPNYTRKSILFQFVT